MGIIGSKPKEFSPSGEVNFDHFQVLRAIGKGSFGKVCIVQKRSTDRLFAMKYMNKAQCEAKEAVGNVLREIEILASVDHPFLVNLWFSFQDEEDMFMVVDLLLGGDLRYHLQQGISFTDEAVRLYILEAASAVDYLHTKNIIHRDIKPDNLLLDSEGHVHLTDFNIATVLKPSHLATSMSGTKPYMAPEVFECALDRCEGYGSPVDWWSLGVTAYEVKRGKRPFDIHSNTLLTEVALMFLCPPKFPAEWSLGLIHIITKLLTVSPASRACSFESLQRIPYAAEVTLEQILKKEMKPQFTPPKDHLNCDPTFELEEMIIESKPLHKKKKRLLKQKSIRENQLTTTPLRNHTGNPALYDSMLIFNRENEEKRKERERREREWQEELDRSMSLSDPTGHGSGFTGSKRKKSLKPSSGSKNEAVEGVLTSLIAASALSFSASIGPIDDLNKQLASNAKILPSTEDRRSKNMIPKQNGSTTRKSVANEQRVNNTSVEIIKEIGYKTLSPEEEEEKGENKDVLKKYDEAKSELQSESKPLRSLRETEAINLNGSKQSKSEDDCLKKSDIRVSKTAKSTQSSKSLDDIPLPTENMKGNHNEKHQMSYKELNQTGPKKFNKFNSCDSYIPNKESSSIPSQLQTFKQEKDSQKHVGASDIDNDKGSSSELDSSTSLTSIQHFKYPPLYSMSSDKICKISSPPFSAPYAAQTSKTFIPPKRSVSLNIQPKEASEKSRSVSSENSLSLKEKIFEENEGSKNILEEGPNESDTKSASDILIASCSLNPLYTSSLEYLNSSSSNSSLNSPHTNKRISDPQNPLSNKETPTENINNDSTTKKNKKKCKTHSEHLPKSVEKLDEATPIEENESQASVSLQPNSPQNLDKKTRPKKTRETDPKDLGKKVLLRHVKKAQSSASLNNYAAANNKHKIYQRSTSSESSKKEKTEYVL